MVKLLALTTIASIAAFGCTSAATAGNTTQSCALTDFTAQETQFLLLNNAIDVATESTLLSTLIKDYDPLVLQDIQLGGFSYSILGQDLTFTPTLDKLNVTGLKNTIPDHVNASSANCIDFGAHCNGDLAIEATMSMTLEEIDTSVTIEISLTLEKPTLASNAQANMFGCAEGAAYCDPFTITTIEVAGVDGKYSGIMDSLLLRFKDAAMQTLAVDFASIKDSDFRFKSSGPIISAITDALVDFSADEINKKGDAYDTFTSNVNDQLLSPVIDAMKVIETDTADVQVDSAGTASHVNGYKVMDMLGEGTFSKVYLCQSDVGTEFALKVINKSILKRKREYKRVDGKLVLSNAFQVLEFDTLELVTLL
ncbi:hypothetical protein BBO99_00007219 [Phytophthora kernoviae]|uniref:Protein kinase domain-containing protein n=2 Tax=Phytophthora kernoviae TaxID=325452 RepID=A0A3R7HFI1_9STRA|nr:hypothetical protein G195_010412 [Phytophthora kernoviae 00238/432]KAG2518527.1 hypothetical protein JM16_006824 [Phytophthora kernoviae]KAG2520179.1 hypothetical protein JM18_006742 [Phytophthora kernoviae]RLM96926.1 hypothetical protein BBI17_007236 [Phytophthora kernoviae]RLN76843.1 hypothetical protein BBO99_00007219 [Phytophthora kernoviae]